MLIHHGDRSSTANRELRAILNFGHTIGHALEAISGYGKYLHGEAIAIGQVLAAQLSVQLLGLPAADLAFEDALLDRAEPAFYHRAWDAPVLVLGRHRHREVG